MSDDNIAEAALQRRGRDLVHVLCGIEDTAKRTGTCDALVAKVFDSPFGAVLEATDKRATSRERHNDRKASEALGGGEAFYIGPGFGPTRTVRLLDRADRHAAVMLACPTHGHIWETHAELGRLADMAKRRGRRVTRARITDPNQAT